MTNKRHKYSTIKKRKITMDIVADDLNNAGEDRPDEIPQPDPGDAPPVQPNPLKS